MKTKQIIFFLIIILLVFYIFWFKPLQKNKSFCVRVINYNPPSNIENFGSIEGYYEVLGAKFKNYDEAMVYCLEKARDFSE